MQEPLHTLPSPVCEQHEQEQTKMKRKNLSKLTLHFVDIDDKGDIAIELTREGIEHRKDLICS